MHDRVVSATRVEQPLTRERVASFLQIDRELVTNGLPAVNLSSVRIEDVVMLHCIIFGELPIESIPTILHMYRVNWEQYRRLVGRYASDVEFLAGGKGAPSPSLRTMIEECVASGYRVVGNLYIAPAYHNARPIGEGLFALAPVRRGQLLQQFTGLLYREENFKVRGMAQDYMLKTRYAGRAYIVYPLDTGGADVDPQHVAAYINEPSAPIWIEGDRVRHAGRDARVIYATYIPNEDNFIAELDEQHEFDYIVRYDDGVDPTTARVHAWEVEYRDSRADHVFQANVAWYDFPFPLELYRSSSGPAHSSGEDTQVEEWCLREWDDATFIKEWPPGDIPGVMASFSDSTAIFDIPPAPQVVSVLKRHHDTRSPVVLFLKEEVFEGLERYGLVLRVTTSTVTVRHVVSLAWGWHIPRCISVGRTRHRGHEEVVPFPLIYACDDIPAGHELLSLYANRVDSRGLPCRQLLDGDHGFLPWWHEHTPVGL